MPSSEEKSMRDLGQASFSKTEKKSASRYWLTSSQSGLEIDRGNLEAAESSDPQQNKEKWNGYDSKVKGPSIPEPTTLSAGKMTRWTRRVGEVFKAKDKAAYETHIDWSAFKSRPPKQERLAYIGGFYENAKNYIDSKRDYLDPEIQKKYTDLCAKAESYRSGATEGEIDKYKSEQSYKLMTETLMGMQKQLETHLYNKDLKRLTEDIKEVKQWLTSEEKIKNLSITAITAKEFEVRYKYLCNKAFEDIQKIKTVAEGNLVNDLQMKALQTWRDSYASNFDGIVDAFEALENLGRDYQQFQEFEDGLKSEPDKQIWSGFTPCCRTLKKIQDRVKQLDPLKGADRKQLTLHAKTFNNKLNELAELKLEHEVEVGKTTLKLVLQRIDDASLGTLTGRSERVEKGLKAIKEKLKDINDVPQKIKEMIKELESFADELEKENQSSSE